MSGESGSKLRLYSSAVLSLQEKSRKEKAVLGRISGYSQGVDVSGFV